MSSVFSRMRRGASGLGSNPSSFDIGYALGNAYGNLWASNAKQRHENKMDDVVKQYLDEQHLQQLSNPIEEKPLVSQEMNGNYVSENTNGINNDALGVGRYSRNYKLATPQNIIDEAKRRGIHQEVIDERMKDVRGQIASRAQASMLPAINQKIYGSIDANGNYIAPTQADFLEARRMVDNYRQYDSAGADKISATIDSRQLGQLDHLARRQQMKDDYLFKLENGMLGQGKPQYRISDGAFNAVQGAITNILSNVALTDAQKQKAIAPYQRLVDAYLYERSGGLGGLNQQGGTVAGNGDERPSLGKSITFENDLLPTIKVALDKDIPIEQIYESVKQTKGVSAEDLKKVENYLRLNEKGFVDSFRDWWDSWKVFNDWENANQTRGIAQDAKSFQANQIANLVRELDKK